MSSQSDVNEIRIRLGENASIESEMKRLRSQMKNLRAEKQDNEDYILNEWDEDEVPEIVNKGVVYKKAEKPRRKAKNKKTKIDCLVMCLEEHDIVLSGVDPDKLAVALLESVRGDPQDEYVLQKNKARNGSHKKK